MVDVEVTGISITSSIGEAQRAPGIVVSILVRTEASDMSGNARLTEQERSTFLSLLAEIEERLANEITRR